MKKLQWGLIGCGDISRKRVAPALRDLPNCALAAVCRAHSDHAETFAKEFGSRKWCRTWQELIADNELDAIYVATPVYLHCAQTIAAAQAGKHVLCEKPMALNPTECNKMIIACRKNNVKFGVAYYRHFYPVIVRIKEIIGNGEIGKPVLAQINAFEFFNPLPDDARHWFVEKDKAGGGPMFDFGCHRIEVLLNILGPVKSAKGFVDNVVFDREVDDTGMAILQFASGAKAVLSVTHTAYEPQDTFDIFGTEGSIHIPVLNAGNLIVKTNDRERMEKHPPHPNIHQPLIDDFTQAVLTDREPAVDGNIGYAVSRIEEQIYSGGS